ncbi:MAG: DUF2269 family protein [Actinomycetota bacterium]
MFTVYTLFKFVHVMAVIMWLGGLMTISLITARLGREQDPSAQAAMARQSAFLGQIVIGPSAGITLIAGIIMVVDSGIGFDTLWIVWGLVGVVVSMGLGATVIRKAGEQLTELAPSAGPGDPRVIALQSRLRVTGLFNLLLLVSVVAMMVFKPTL